MLGAIIPAAGASVRMGRPKALLLYRGKSFIQTIIDSARTLGARPIMIAIAQGESKVLSGIDLRDVVIAVNTNALSTGQIGSIRAGIAELRESTVEGVIVWPVDQPHVSQTTVQALMDAFAASRSAVVIPRFNGRRGHPVIFSRAVFRELLEIPTSEGARSVVRADPRRVLEIDVADPAVLEDIDTPEAYEALVRRGSAL